MKINHLSRFTWLNRALSTTFSLTTFFIKLGIFLTGYVIGRLLFELLTK